MLHAGELLLLVPAGVQVLHITHGQAETGGQVHAVLRQAESGLQVLHITHRQAKAGRQVVCVASGLSMQYDTVKIPTTVCVNTILLANLLLQYYNFQHLI